MTIQIGKTKDANNKLNKTFNIVKTITGTLKDGTSIENPTIIIESDTTLINCNYAYIPEFNKYYYIIDTPFIVNNMFELRLRRDVLMSNRDEINNLYGIVIRSSTYSNPYIIDGNMRNVQYNNYKIISSDKSFDDELSHYIVVAG